MTWTACWSSATSRISTKTAATFPCPFPIPWQRSRSCPTGSLFPIRFSAIRGTMQSKLLQEQYRRYGAELNCLQRFDQLSTLIQFLRKNTGVAYLHKDITRFYPDLVSIPIAEETGPFTTYLVWSPNGALARAPKRLFSVFKNYFDRLAAPTQPPPAGPEA